MKGFFIYMADREDPFQKIYTILRQNRQMDAALGHSVRSLIQKLRIERRFGSMTNLQFTQTVHALNNLLIATRDLNLEEITEAQKTLNEYCQFSDAISSNERDLGALISIWVTAIVFMTLIIVGILSFPPVLVLLIMPTAYLIGAIAGEEYGIWAANQEVNALANKATVLANTNTANQDAEYSYDDDEGYSEEYIPHNPATPVCVG